MSKLILSLAVMMIFSSISFASPKFYVETLIAQKKLKKTKLRKKKKNDRKRKRKKRAKQKVDVPVDLGLGPSFFRLTGPVERQQTWHYGVKLSLAAVIDQALIKSQKHRIPKKYRRHVNKVGEVRFRPGLIGLLPDALIVSPPHAEKSGIYGANWRFISVGTSLIRKPNLGISTGLNLTYAYLTSSDEIASTHFLRPGLDLTARFELPLSKAVLISFGWSSNFYPPQSLGGSIFTLGNLDGSIWHIGQAFALFHYRFPYSVRL